MQGSMKTDRSTIRTMALALAGTLAVSAAAPLVAQAGPLLSGYGGPGQGNQAILGSTLLGGSGGGASGGGGANGPGSQAAPTTGAAGGATKGTSHPSGAAHRARGARAAVRPGHVRAVGLASGSYPALERTASSGTFGMSGADFSYVALAAGALAFAGVFMRRLARPRSAQGH
jgi:hypothetical protein